MGRRFWGHIAAALLTLFVALAGALALTGCEALPELPFLPSAPQQTVPDWFDPTQLPAYDGAPSVEVNANTPGFTPADRGREVFEDYSPLDKRGRCGTAFALLGRETMPDEPRGDIASVKPTGWQVDTYDWVDGGFLYNRCHLIAWQLAAENDNELNLITGTRYFNVQGMLPYEDAVANYIRSTGNHVLYRVTPVFEGRNLVASGVLMEAESVEDGGAGVRFCVWCYNVEPGVAIDYRTGKSHADGTVDATEPLRYDGVPDELRATVEDAAYVLNTNSHKFHRPDCPSVADMSERNTCYFGGTRDQAINLGYDPCGYCKP